MKPEARMGRLGCLEVKAEGPSGDCGGRVRDLQVLQAGA